jgi:hypothetical protein
VGRKTDLGLGFAFVLEGGYAITKMGKIAKHGHARIPTPR